MRATTGAQKNIKLRLWRYALVLDASSEDNGNRSGDVCFVPKADIASTAPRRLDRGDVDLLHLHHHVKCAFCFTAASGERLGQDAWCDLPGDAPLVLAPAASAFLPAIADDGVPVSIGLVLIVGRDLEGESFVMFERRTAVDADTRDAGNREFDD